ncbi:hypothetical protein CHELA41_24204 [Hyphomicrobiales bacterium]|nr:hypothetical protein CHELA41_24204 [Hyphomicrobiales bacterium]
MQNEHVRHAKARALGWGAIDEALAMIGGREDLLGNGTVRTGQAAWRLCHEQTTSIGRLPSH